MLLDNTSLWRKLIGKVRLSLKAMSVIRCARRAGLVAASACMAINEIGALVRLRYRRVRGRHDPAPLPSERNFGLAPQPWGTWPGQGGAWVAFPLARGRSALGRRVSR